VNGLFFINIHRPLRSRHKERRDVSAFHLPLRRRQMKTNPPTAYQLDELSRPYSVLALRRLDDIYATARRDVVFAFRASQPKGKIK